MLLVFFPTDFEVVLNWIVIESQMNLNDVIGDRLDIIKLISSDKIFQYRGKLSDLIHDLPFREFI